MVRAVDHGDREARGRGAALLGEHRAAGIVAREDETDRDARAAERVQLAAQIVAQRQPQPSRDLAGAVLGDRTRAATTRATRPTSTSPRSSLRHDSALRTFLP